MTSGTRLPFSKLFRIDDPDFRLQKIFKLSDRFFPTHFNLRSYANFAERYSISSTYPSNPFPQIVFSAYRETYEKWRNSSRSLMLLKCTSTVGMATAFSASNIAMLV